MKVNKVLREDYGMASPFTFYSKNEIHRKIIDISPILKRYLCTRERYLFMLERSQGLVFRIVEN
jgi:hypothetical protein